MEQSNFDSLWGIGPSAGLEGHHLLTLNPRRLAQSGDWER
jgi:hypothetical protein